MNSDLQRLIDKQEQEDMDAYAEQLEEEVREMDQPNLETAIFIDASKDDIDFMTTEAPAIWKRFGIPLSATSFVFESKEEFDAFDDAVFRTDIDAWEAGILAF